MNKFYKGYDDIEASVAFKSRMVQTLQSETKAEPTVSIAPGRRMKRRTFVTVLVAATLLLAVGTAVADEQKILDEVLKRVDLRPDAIIRKFDLRRPIYSKVAAYGHMGREDVGAPWEERDLAPLLRKAVLG